MDTHQGGNSNTWIQRLPFVLSPISDATKSTEPLAPQVLCIVPFESAALL